ncbi:MAG: hypothetical protein K2Z25_03320 [Beijerinckiaceae bacterium]|jgi:hypothetical protein|nr:hypothetical protein [Beijerinckiaceae bacterium]
MANRASRVLLAGGLLLAAQPAFAQEGLLFKNIMEGVIGKRGGEDIEYRERPPLVVPPGSALPRPQEPASARTAAWPNDPDVARRREAAEARILPFTESEKTRNNAWLNQTELRRGPAARATGRPVVVEELSNSNNQIEPIRRAKEEAARRGQEDLAQLNYGSEPPRRLLTEPPVGYRRPAGSAPVGPGQSGPQEDKQAVGQREFLIGTTPLQ